jgi:hypothetical protein
VLWGGLSDILQLHKKSHTVKLHCPEEYYHPSTTAIDTPACAADGAATARPILACALAGGKWAWPIQAKNRLCWCCLNYVRLHLRWQPSPPGSVVARALQVFCYWHTRLAQSMRFALFWTSKPRNEVHERL